MKKIFLLSFIGIIFLTGCSSNYDVSKDIKEDCINAIEYADDYLNGLMDQEDAGFKVGLQYNGKCSEVVDNDEEYESEDDSLVCTNILTLEQALKFGSSSDVKKELKKLKNYCK